MTFSWCTCTQIKMSNSELEPVYYKLFNLLCKKSTSLYLSVHLVLWNPWIENAQKMSDFDDEGYKNMICVEPGAVSERITLKPSESRQFSQTIKVISSA